MSEQDLQDLPEEAAPEEGAEEESAGLSEEQRAELVGWNPEFDGPGKKTASEFLSKRDEDLGLMRSNLEKLEKRISEQNRTMQSMSTFLTTAQRKAEEQGYSRGLQEIRDRKYAATESGDVAAVKAADAEEETFKKEFEEAQKPVPQPDGRLEEIRGQISAYTQKYPEVFETRAQAEDWYNEFQWAVRRGDTVDKSMDKATRIVSQKYKIGGRIPGPEDGGSGGGAKKQSFASLPKEAKDGYYQFAKSNSKLNTPAGKEEYAKAYYEEYGNE
jgi:hypothetical protein